LTHTSSSTRVVFQTKVVYQAKCFVSKQDVYQVGLIPKRTYTEVPPYYVNIAYNIICVFYGTISLSDVYRIDLEAIWIICILKLRHCIFQIILAVPAVAGDRTRVELFLCNPGLCSTFPACGRYLSED
jgi:hypothetical protein